MRSISFLATLFQRMDNLCYGNSIPIITFIIKIQGFNLLEKSKSVHSTSYDLYRLTDNNSYRKWCSTDVLVENVQDANRPLTEIPPELRQNDTIQPDESDPYRGYWVEYYDPTKLTTLDTLFAYNMNGTLKYRPPSLAVATGKCENQ